MHVSLNWCAACLGNPGHQAWLSRAAFTTPFRRQKAHSGISGSYSILLALGQGAVIVDQLCDSLGCRSERISGVVICVRTNEILLNDDPRKHVLQLKAHA